MSPIKALQRLGLSVQALEGTPGEASEASQLAREAARAFTDELEQYQRNKQNPPTPEERRASAERARDSILESPPEDLTFGDLERLTKIDAELVLKRWDEVKEAARADLASGWRAGRALEACGRSAWERANFLAIRERLYRGWQPRHEGEAMLLDEMAQYETIRVLWLRILSEMSHESETQTTLRYPKPDRDQPRKMDAAEATAEAMRMVERSQGLYLSALRAFLSLRKGKSAFIVQRSGLINLAIGQQANVCLQTPEPEAEQ
jgi:hypothetical protein